MAETMIIALAAMIILSARRTWITLRKLRSIQATPVLAQTMIMVRIEEEAKLYNPQELEPKRITDLYGIKVGQ